MALLQELTQRQMDEAVKAAVSRSVPATITISVEGHWANYHSRMLAVGGGRLLLQAPVPDGSACQHEFVRAERIGVSFKLKHHKHVFVAVVAGQEIFPPGLEQDSPALAVCLPTHMQRLQRRAYIRADVPEGCIIRASFWLGGRLAEPAGTSPDRPVWSGQVTNISAGGFQVRTERDAAENIEVGEAVGVRLVFGAARRTVYADAQFRHSQASEGGALLGFQFVGLMQTPEGRDALGAISDGVRELSRQQSKSPSRRES